MPDIISQIDKVLAEIADDDGKYPEMWTINPSEIADILRAVKPLITRTAEDERADVLAFMRSEREKQSQAAAEFDLHDNARATARCLARAEAIVTLHAYITRGDHEGASTR